MRKPFWVILLALSFMFGIRSLAVASPTYYTFQGYIYSLQLRTLKGDIIDGNTSYEGLSVGKTVTYTFLVDPEKVGTTKDNIGNEQPYPGSYYADYISGSALHAVGPGYWNDPLYVAEYHLAWDIPTTDPYFGNYGWLWGNSDDNPLDILLPFHFISDWHLYALAGGLNRAYDSQGNYYQLESLLSLTEIAPVPEPATMILLGSGLIGLLGFGRRKLSRASNQRGRV